MKNINIILTIFIFMYCFALSVEAQFNYKYSEETLGAKNEKDYNDCVKKYQNEIKKDSTAHINYYNLACCLSNLEKFDESIQILKIAIRKGFKDYLELQSNNDFVNLHDKSEWTEISKLCKQNAINDYKSKSGYVDILKIYFEDKMERLLTKMGPNTAFEVNRRDSIRQNKIKKLFDNNLLHTSEDYYYSASVFQHGKDSNGYKIYHDLAGKAMQMDSSRKDFRWLFAASKDRLLQSLGKPQHYGTEMSYDENGFFSLGKFDTFAIKDDERLWMIGSTLEQTLMMIDGMNYDFKNRLSNSQEILYRMYKQDIDSRQSFQNVGLFMYDPIEFVDANDKSRLEAVKELIKKDSIKTAEDYYFSSFILYHSGGIIDSNNYKLAHIFAKKALDLGLYFYFEFTAQPLVAASKDRYLLSLGKPQWYGTQYIKNTDGYMEFYKIDENAVTDEERIFWCGFPLDYLKKLITDYNMKLQRKK